MRSVKSLVVGSLILLVGLSAAQAQSVSDSDFLFIQPTTYDIADNAIDTNFRAPIFIENSIGLGAISIPLTFPGHPELRIDTTVVTGGNAGVSYGPAGNNSIWTIKTSLVDNLNKGILLGFITFASFGPTSDTLCFVHFDLDSSGINGTVPLDSGEVNRQRLRFTDIAAQDIIPTWTGATINIGTPQPTISVDPASLTYSRVIGTGNPPAQSIAISNTGAGTLNWSASGDQPWLSVTPASGAGDASVSVSVNTAGLAAGVYNGNVTVSDPTASNSPQIVSVTLTLTEPSLAAAPPSLSFSAQAGGANPTGQSFTLSASSSAAISWTAASTNAWLVFTPDNGITPNTINVTPDITGLAPGSYFDTVLVTAENAANSPFPIPVSLTLTAPPEIALAPPSVAFASIEGGADPAPDTVSLTNAGAGTLNFSATTDETWLVVAPTSGTAPQQLEISASTVGLTAGLYTGHVIVSSPDAVNSPESVQVTLDVQANPPVLDVSPVSAAFTATEGDAVGSPTAVEVIIVNTGGGTLDYTLTGMAGTIVQVSKLSGTAPDTFEVSVDPSGLVAGSYSASFEITAAGAIGSPVTFDVSLEVAAGPPTIELAPALFSFAAVEGGANPAGQELSISNVGGSQPLNWSASNVQPWLTIDPVSGAAPSTATLNVDITGLVAGTYEDTITITAAGATNTPQTAVVVLDVAPPAPSISVAPAALTFGATVGDPNPATQTLSIINAGGGILDWTASKSEAWLTIEPVSGTAPSTMDVDVDITGLTPGTYTDEIAVASAGADNSPVVVPVTLVISDLPPQLAVAPSALSFSAQQDDVNPPSQSFAISNAGGGLLTWSVTAAAGWISVDPISGTGNDDIAVSVDITGLVAGTYVDSVRVDAGAIAGSPAYVQITLTLDPPPPPSIVLDPSSFAFTALFGGGNPAAQSLEITNGGGQSLDWSAAQNSGWLTLSATGGTAPSVIDLNIDISGLAVGTYYDTVVISSGLADNSPQVAAVQLDVVDNPPVLTLSPSEIHFEIVAGDPDPALQILSVANTGAGSLNWSATKKAAWLSLAPTSGVAPGSIDLAVSGAGLVPGTYRDTVVVISNEAVNSPQVAIVTFVVKSVAKPSIELQPDSLHFIVEQGQRSDPQCTYVFIDGNGGRLIWRASTDAEWVDLSRDSCNISYPLCITVDAAGVPPGTYCDSVAISGDATNSPQFLHVCMDVRSGGEQPVLVVTDTAYSFTALEGDTGLSAPQRFDVTNAGTGTLTWSASTLAAWVVIDPTSGTAPTAGAFRVDPFGLPAGDYQATVEFDAPGALDAPQFVTIGLTIEPQQEPPLMAVTPPEIFVEALVGTGQEVIPVSISNAGGGSLTYSIDPSLEPWLALSKLSGTAPDDLDATVSWDGLPAGTYYDTIVVTSPEAANSPQVIPVVLTLSGPLVEVDSVRVGEATGSPGDQVIVPVFFDNSVPLFGLSVPLVYTSDDVVADSVSFAGSRVETINITAASVDSTEHVVRIGVIPIDSTPIPSGSGLLANVYFSILPSAPNQVVVLDTITPSAPPISLSFIDTTTTEFVPGFRSGSLSVTGAAPTVLAVSPDSLHFAASAGGANPSTQSVRVDNTGAGILTFSASEAVPWLTLSPASGSQGDTVVMSVDISGLSEDLYTGVITFTSPEADNDSVVVPVTLAVGPPADPPVIVLTPDQVSFVMMEGGPVPAPDTIVVSNAGGGTLDWVATHGESWLSVTPLAGGDGAQVEVAIIDAELAAGDYFDTIEFTDPAASNSPRPALVELQVRRPASPDTVFLSSVVAAPGDTVEIPVRIKNTFSATAITLPFVYSGSGVELLTGATPTPRAGTSVYAIFTELVDPVAQTGLYGFIAFGSGMPAGDGDVLNLRFAIAPDAPDQVVTIDTTFLPPGNQLSLNDALANTIYPEFVAGSITIASPSSNSVRLSEESGEPGETVIVEVYAENAHPLDRLVLPLALSSSDLSVSTVDFSGTRCDGVSNGYVIADAQHVTVDIDCSDAPLSAGSGVVARLHLAIAPAAAPQTVFVDASGEVSFMTSGGSQSLIVPQFTRGIVYVVVPTSTGDDPLLPDRFALGQNYPNPFNPSTTIAYALPAAGWTRLTVHNLLGQQIATLLDRYQSAGEHTAVWDGRDARGHQVASGIYFYRLESRGEALRMKMTLMK